MALRIKTALSRAARQGQADGLQEASIYLLDQAVHYFKGGDDQKASFLRHLASVLEVRSKERSAQGNVKIDFGPRISEMLSRMRSKRTK